MKISMKKENYACFFKECNIEIWCTIQKRKENTSLKKNWESLWLCESDVYNKQEKFEKKDWQQVYPVWECVIKVHSVKCEKQEKNRAEKKEKEEKRKIHFHCTTHSSKKSINLKKN